jgi:multidrug efflux pump subunit AcrA (membrane-fusion protein)
MTTTTFNRIVTNFERRRGVMRSTAELPTLRPAQPASVSSWKRGLWTASAVALLVLVAIVARRWWQTPAAASERHEPTVPLVSIVQPAPATAGEVQLPATIRPWQAATLSARVSGYLKEWKVDLGDHVKAGDLLAVIETPELDQELAQAMALANEAKAAIEQAKAERNEAEADLQAGEAEVRRARAEAELARSQLVRREKLVAKNIVPQEEFDTFTKQVETRNAEVTAVEAELARRQANLTTRRAVIEAREATSKSREASVHRLQDVQAFQRIFAPFGGVITRRSAEVGMLVTAGQEPLFVIEDMSRVRVQVNVPQAYAVKTRVGATTTVALPESPAQSTSATITRTADAVDATNRTMLAEIDLDNADGRWQPGSYVQVRLATTAADSTWTIPASTLQMQVDGPHVAVIDQANQVEIRAVKLGRDLGNRIVVTAGITGDERLVVNPGSDLTNGAKVKIRDTESRLAQR